MELTVATILVSFAGVFLICFMKGAFGGGFSIVGIPLLSIVMDPVTAGGLLAPLFIAMDLFALRYWKPSTWSKPDVVLLLPGLVIGIGLGYLLFRFLDPRAIAIVMAAITLTFVGLWLVGGAEVTTRPRSTPKAITAGLASGITTMVAHAGGPPLAMYLLPLPQQGTLRGNDQSVLHRRQRDQGGAVAAAGETNGCCLQFDGGLPVRRSHRRMAWLAASRRAGSAPSLWGLLCIAGRDGVEVIVGRRFRLSRVNFGCQ
jgi:hypothetical protein